MIKVYIAKVDGLRDEVVFEESYRKVSAQRREKINKLKQTEDKIRSLGAELLLQYALEQDGISEYNIAHSEKGKPYLQDKSFCLQKGQLPYFNLSHAGDYVVCAISNQEIGIDIERMRDNIKVLNLAKRFFSEEEQQKILDSPEEKRLEVFTKIWTVKESCFKYTGEGLTRDLGVCSIDLTQGIITDSQTGKQYYCKTWNEGNYFLSICFENEEKEIFYRQMEL